MVIRVAMVQADDMVGIAIEIEMVSTVWYAKRNYTGSAAVLAHAGPKVGHRNSLKEALDVPGMEL